MDNFIKIRGARSHNLKNVSLDIPRDSLVVVTGLSGSGKSSLAFDTIFAEGNRKYMDTLSSYARQFIGPMEKPDVESIDGLSPVIAIDQKTTGNNPRSTVGTITEIYDYLRVLFARASKAYSPATGKEMVRYSDEKIHQLLLEKFLGKKCCILSPLVTGRKGHYKELFETLRKRGYTEVRIDGEIMDLGEVESVDRYKVHNIELVVDKLKPCPEDDKRIASSVGTALNFGKGSLSVLEYESGTLYHYSRNLVCPDTGISLPQPAPHSFSFNSPQGYCPHCKGLGTIMKVDMDSIIPDRSKSIAQGGIVPLGEARENAKFDIIRSMARKYSFSLFDPISELSDEVISLIIYGSDELFRVGEGNLSQMVSFHGIVEDIDDKVVCPVCGGTRLRKETQYFKIDGKTISEVSAMEISELREWLASLPSRLDGRQKAIATDILRQLIDKVDFLVNVGLDYLTLDRPTQSLSGGESQRIRLATQIGTKLVNVLYILDEPSIGLHQSDNVKLLSSLKALRDAGNTVIVVEHDTQTMLASDWLVDVGPGAGEKGGNICYNGPVEKILGAAPSDSDSITLKYLKGMDSIKVPFSRRLGNGNFLVVKGARGNNLRNIDVRIPLGCIVGVSGVSGSGKSSLVNDTLVPVLKAKFFRSSAKALPYDSIEGIEAIDKVIEIDQSPIGRTPRSNPATYTGVFDDIRALFGQTPDAKVRGFSSSRFSFNVKGGRCEECKGAGIKVLEMNFLPSVNVTCPECRGRRYKDDTLAVRYKGKNISQVLEMTISEALDFFASIPSIARKLQTLRDVGLGYVRLGQSAVTLSGGESQRMKLACELSRKDTGRTLYVLDEPTTGLHSEDIKVLLGVLNSLVDKGNSAIIIEHNPDVLKSVDYLIDMGPGGGKNGGTVVSCGTPEQVSCDPDSVTGPFLDIIHN